MSRPSISLVVIARNEESLIGQCLQSACFCDELVLVDSFSTDGTVDVAKAHGAKIFSRTFQGYIDQKQFALEQATGDWVLSLDADEQATFELQRELRWPRTSRQGGPERPRRASQITHSAFQLPRYCRPRRNHESSEFPGRQCRGKRRADSAQDDRESRVEILQLLCS